MEPGTAIRLASAVIGPLVKKLFVTEGPGAGLVGKPVRISGYVSFKGEKRSLAEADLRHLAAKLVTQALRTGERPIAADEQQAVVDALAKTLHALGDIEMTDLDAVRLGSADFARALRRAAGEPERQLSADATYFYERLLEAACLHILHFFTQRSTFVAHALVEQTRVMAQLTLKVDELIRRDPLPGAEDAAFEQQYLPYVVKKHGQLTIYGIDLGNSPTRWPLDAAYLSLEATALPGLYEPLSPDARTRLLRNLGAHTASADRDAPAAKMLELKEGEIIARARLAPGPRPADRALAGSRRVLLRGEAGSGKSTLVQWLAVTAARQELTPQTEYLYDRVPFVLPLRTLTRHGEQLPDPQGFLAAVGCPIRGVQPDGWAHRVLSAGRGLVLVDGIDEIPDRERERARDWLRELMDAYDGDNRWLVTSRPSAVGADWLAEDGFTELTLAAMRPADIATFVKRWHKAAQDGTEDDAVLRTYEAQLLAAVRTKPDLGRLATNPLMCGLICALHRDRRGYLPHGRKDLYEAALSMLLTRRDRERDMAVPDLREEPQLDILQRLAYWLIKNGRTEMDRSQAVDIIARALPSVPEAAALGGAPAVFAHFLQRSGLLRGPGPDTVEFIHRTFQDFLGARAAVEESDFGMLTGRAGDDQWEDVIRMAVAQARPRERVEIIQDLINRGDESPDRHTRDRVYLLAAACLEHATSLAPEVRRAVETRTATLIPPQSDHEARALAEVGPLILGLLPTENADDWDAYNVVIAASHVRSEEAVSFLAHFADHPFLPIRSQLMWAWSRFDAAGYADQVIAQLDPSDLLYTLQSDEHLRQLARLGLRPHRLDVRGGVSARALAAHIAGSDLVDIRLANVKTPDLGFLAGQAHLYVLAVDQCPDLTDLTGIGALPIRRLDLESDRPDLDLGALVRLTRLEVLNLRGPAGTAWSPRALAADAPLELLSVSGEMGTVHGLEGLGGLSGLRELLLNPASSPATSADWQEVRNLAELANLRVSAASLEFLPREAAFHGVFALTLVEGGGERVLQAALRRLPEAFPDLRSCQFAGATPGEGIDIAPLAALPQLRTVYVDGGRDRVRGAELLPSSVELRHA